MSEIQACDAVRIGTVIAHWEAAGMARWFAVDPAFDKALRDTFLADHQRAAQGELPHWTRRPCGMLALILLLDQIPRNIFRGTPRMFVTDGLALQLARGALDRGCDEAFVPDLRMFFYLPFTHSECLEDQRLSLAKRRELGPRIERRAEEHLRIIERSGAFRIATRCSVGRQPPRRSPISRAAVSPVDPGIAARRAAVNEGRRRPR